MLFKKIDENNIKELYPFLYGCDYRLCDYAPCVLLLWSGYCDYYYCIEDDVLYLRETIEEQISFLLPVTKDKNLSKALLRLKQHCQQNNLVLKIVAIPEAYVETVQDALNLTAVAMGQEDADYGYLATDLVSLVGHKYNAKRNHVSRFARDNPTAVFKPLTADDKPLLDEFLTKYHSNDGSISYSYDIIAERNFVQNFDKYDFFGGGIFLDGKIIAFSFGDKIGDTLFIHIEKALREYVGLYETINNVYAKAFATQGITYIDREEDMGDLGLRESKQNYHPIMFVKYFVKQN